MVYFDHFLICANVPVYDTYAVACAIARVLRRVASALAESYWQHAISAGDGAYRFLKCFVFASHRAATLDDY